MVKNLLAMRETQVPSLSRKDPLEKEMTAHSRILAWRIQWTEEPGGLPSVGSQKNWTQYVPCLLYPFLCQWTRELLSRLSNCNRCCNGHCGCVVTQSCPTLFDPMDCNLPGSLVHGISQARILEWFAISFSKGSSWPRDWTHVSYVGGRVLYHWATREAQWTLGCMYLFQLDFCLDVCPGVGLLDHLKVQVLVAQYYLTLCDPMDCGSRGWTIWQLYF